MGVKFFLLCRYSGCMFILCMMFGEVSRCWYRYLLVFMLV